MWQWRSDVVIISDKVLWSPVDCGSNNSGYYELQAVLTHKGRSSSSGHYVACVDVKKVGRHKLKYSY